MSGPRLACACGAMATWIYMPGTGAHCDACVPRGCSCNLDEHGVETFDDDGRRLPCCEYMHIAQGILTVAALAGRERKGE